MADYRIWQLAAIASSAELALFTDRLHQSLARLDGPSRAGRCDPSCDFLLRPPESDVLTPSPAVAAAGSSARPQQEASVQLDALIGVSA